MNIKDVAPTYFGTVPIVLFILVINQIDAHFF